MAGEKQLTDGRSDGAFFGQSASDWIGFYGTNPIVQPTGSAQAAVSTGTSETTANVAALANALRTALVNLGLISGAS